MFKVFVKLIREKFAAKTAHLHGQTAFLNTKLNEAINEAFKETLDLIFAAEVKRDEAKNEKPV